MTYDQLTCIANLRRNPDFQELLTALQADIDDLSDRLHAAKTDEEERRLTAEWRAMRNILGGFRGRVELADAETEEIRRALNLAPGMHPVNEQDMSRFKETFKDQAAVLDMLRRQYDGTVNTPPQFPGM